ncbi:hypothetical protein Btru_039654 [Bulinus truncatus]|nr:hypothetical protein Btru_039654 [Bulinus truncatus]
MKDKIIILANGRTEFQGQWKSRSLLKQKVLDDIKLNRISVIKTTLGGGSLIPDHRKQDLISPEAFFYFNLYVNSFLLIAVSILAIVTNTITVLVFAHAGVRESVNVAMLAVAVIDLTRGVCTIINRVSGVIGLTSPADGISWNNYTTVYLDLSNVFIGYVSYSMVAYISVERCLCVVMPFNVKLIFTPRFTGSVLASLSVLVYAAFFVMHLVYVVEWRHDVTLNATVAVLAYSEFYFAHGEGAMNYFHVMSIVFPSTCVAILCVTSVIIVHQLRRSAKIIQAFNTSNTPASVSSKPEKTMSTREKQVTKMLLVVILVFIINLIPRVMFDSAQLVELEF